jgi:membrane protein DedA with SNARE-associated domain
MQSSFIAQVLLYRYPILFPLAVIEGPVLMIFSGFLVRIGTFEFWPAYLILMAGDLTGDVMWYLVGRHGARRIIGRYGKFFNLTESSVEKMEHLFHKHQGRILFISKITTGFGFAIATLIAAGAARVPFRKYLTINFLGEFIWVGILMGIGFFFGNVYTAVSKGFRWVAITGIIAFGITAMYFFSTAMKKRFKDVKEL